MLMAVARMLGRKLGTRQVAAVLLLFTVAFMWVAVFVPKPAAPPLPPTTAPLAELSVQATAQPALNWAMFPGPVFPQPSTPVSCYQADIVPPPSHTVDQATLAASRSFLGETERLRVTAVMLHWKRTAELRLLVEHFATLGIFDEIVVWNNNPSVTIGDADVAGPGVDRSRLKLRIFNEGVNYKDEAKYLACLQATNPVCYYQDDDWDSRGYVESLYHAFLKAPLRIHSVTDAYTYLTDLVWSFGDPKIGLHSGFSWIGCGAFFLRSHVVNFKRQMDRLLDADLKRIADVFFSIWLNQLPYIYPYNIRKLTSNHAFSSEEGFFDLQYRAGVESIRILRQGLLKEGDADGFRPRPLTDFGRELPRSAWAICPQDECLFLTNSAEPAKALYFDGKSDLDRATRHNLPDAVAIRPQEQSTYLAAVDGARDTCWLSNVNAKPGDYFGLELTRPAPLSHLKLIFNHTWTLQNRLRLEGSLDGTEWVPLPFSDVVVTDRLAPEHTAADPSLYADGQCLNPKEAAPVSGTSPATGQNNRQTMNKVSYAFKQTGHIYRFVRFRLGAESAGNRPEPFVICELRAVFQQAS